MYKELTKFNTKKPNNPIEKMGKGPEKPLLKSGHTDGQYT